MIKKIDLGISPHGREVFAEPTPLGLIGLALGCAALTPIAFGHGLSPAGLKTAAMFCLLFGGGCQFLAGMMNFANKNLYGGTILTAFSFNWMMNWWALDSIASGTVPNHEILLATDVASLGIFVVITYGFGFFSKLLFYFLLDIDLLYACKVTKALTLTKSLDLPIALCTVGLGLIALWIAFAMLINPTSGRTIFKIPGPMFAAVPKPAFDLGLRKAIFETLYEQWKKHAFEEMELEQLQERVSSKFAGQAIEPDVHYLAELGALILSDGGAKGGGKRLRLTAAGIDLYEQLVLSKFAA
jgi:succinate-acetate transporter protein